MFFFFFGSQLFRYRIFPNIDDEQSANCRPSGAWPTPSRHPDKIKQAWYHLCEQTFYALMAQSPNIDTIPGSRSLIVFQSTAQVLQKFLRILVRTKPFLAPERQSQ